MTNPTPPLLEEPETEEDRAAVRSLFDNIPPGVQAFELEWVDNLKRRGEWLAQLLAAAEPEAAEFLAWLEIQQIPPRIENAIRAQLELEIGAAKVDSTAPPVRIPRLTPANASAYIAQVAKAVQLGQLRDSQGRALLYAAQLLLAMTPPAQRSLPAQRGRPRVIEAQQG